MKRFFSVTIILVLLSSSIAYAAELNAAAQKDEKQKEINSITAPVENKTWGNSFSIGIPVGLYNEDVLTGLEFTYPIKDRLVIRLNAYILADRYRTDELTWKGIKNELGVRPVAYPSLSLIGRSPLFYNLRLYGGVTVGVAYANKQTKVMPHIEGFGGVEFFASRHHSFFAEFGGGAAITKRNIDFSRGVLITGGSRFYF